MRGSSGFHSVFITAGKADLSMRHNDGRMQRLAAQLDAKGLGYHRVRAKLEQAYLPAYMVTCDSMGEVQDAAMLAAGFGQDTCLHVDPFGDAALVKIGERIGDLALTPMGRLEVVANDYNGPTWVEFKGARWAPRSTK